MIKIIVIYYNQFQLNYNKILTVKGLRRNKELFESNNYSLEFLDFSDASKFIDSLKEKLTQNDSLLNNCILWLHQKIGSYLLTFPEIRSKINNTKILFWMDDLHFAGDNIDSDERYKFSNLIISPSTYYFQNINSNLISKSKFLFYFFDENLINNYNPINNFILRKSKILLSGKINSLSYKSRKQLYTNYFYNKKLYDWLEHPGYYNQKHDTYHEKYYNKLSEYKGAVLGLANFPLNFLLAKSIEILGCGCLGFFEESDLYEKFLGLKPFIHYIPIFKNKNDELIISNNQFAKFIESNVGKQIAINGYKFIKTNFNSQSFSIKVIQILNSFSQKLKNQH